MRKKDSAGLLLYRRCGELQVLLVHPGGPFWTKKDAGSWSVPKGEFSEGEDALQAARREFTEETGFTIEGDFCRLDPVKQSGGKVVHAWAVEADCDPSQVRSNSFSMEWPPKSGQIQQFPEVDRAEWFAINEARKRIIKGQVELLEQLAAKLDLTRESESETPKERLI
ncbi:MAG TPA: NUDIX domain-containing protein [Candidatus Binatia bacterium]|nr:NUDIX domain-containing protein [Candidatus Binatia bacterium]